MMSSGVAALGVVILGLSGTIAFEIMHQDVQHTSPSVGTMPQARAKAPGPAMPPPAALDGEVAEILARPIFTPDRKPTGSSGKSVAGLARLTGVVVTGSRKIAIFAGPTDGHPVVAEEGSRLNAYKVTEISNRGVTVVGPTGTMLVTPAFDAARPSPPPKPAAAVLPKPTASQKH